MTPPMEGWPWFIYDDDQGFTYFATEAEARAAADARLKMWKEDAEGCSEWSDEVGSLVWGRLHQAAEERIFDLDEPAEDDFGEPQTECADYALVDVHEMPPDYLARHLARKQKEGGN